MLSVELTVPQHRRAVETVWQIDAAMADVVARSTDAGLGRIKLAWWRERLEQLDSGAPPAEPRLRAVAAELIPRGIAGTLLSEIEPGWATLLDDAVDVQLVADRGARLFAMIAALLGKSDARLAEAGALWALVSVAKADRPELSEAAGAYAKRLRGYHFPMGLRALTLLARLAARDLARGLSGMPQAMSRRRAGSVIHHLWSGTITQ